jgi:toxin FitB
VSTILDTNVLSELLRASPDRAVLAWLGTQAEASLFVTAVTQAEMMLGARLLPAGKRRSALMAAVRGIFEEDFAGRVLPFDGAAAPVYAELVSSRRTIGRPIAQFDAQIASIAQQHGMGLATRDIEDFAECGIAVVNPWLLD